MRNSNSAAGVILLCFLSLLMLSGCSVYHTDTVSVEKAVESNSNVRLVTLDNVYYEFKKLERENGQLYGLTSRNSETAKMLLDHKQIPYNKMTRIALADDEIQAVYLKNKSVSRLVNYGVPVVGAAGLLTVTSDSFRPDLGN